MKKTISCFLLIFFLMAFSKKTTLIEIPKSWPKPLYNFNLNPLSEPKILLGRVLFYDPILSINNQISCASCHSPYNAFTHVDHKLSHGVFDSIGTRNAPALMNLAWQNSFMWDGAINHLDMQSLAPISHPSEMASSINAVVAKLENSPIYPSLFFNAFGDSTLTGQKTLLAISQFMLTLVSANSKYDQVKNATESFSKQEESGYQLFLQHCNSCHQEPLFSDYSFQNNGLNIDTLLADYGRVKVTQNTNDSLKFKVPSLRNIEFSYPYMHDGRFGTLNEVLNHYTSVKTTSNTLALALKEPIVLSSNEKVDLISFLLTLSDKEFLFNKNNLFPKEILLPH